MVTGPSAPVARCPRAALSRKASSILRGTEVLGRKITPRLAQEIGSQFTTRIEGTCIKHRYGSATIKMYDKFALVLRLETTCNDVSAFKHHRKVEHRKAFPCPTSQALAPTAGLISA